MKYIQKGYGVQFVVVLICILLSAVANVAGSMFLKSLIDDYISPLLLQASPVFTGLLHALMSMAVIYLIGIATTFIYNWLMVSISQGVLKKVRDEMFAHMQKLPIRYFDTHTHGDLMSHFTNDTDTLQQMLSQSVPQMFSSAMTIISVFIGMLVTNVWLTLFVLLGVCVMLKVVRSWAVSPRSTSSSSRSRSAGSRLYRGDDQRSEGHQGVLPRGKVQGAVRCAQR